MNARYGTAIAAVLGTFLSVMSISTVSAVETSTETAQDAQKKPALPAWLVTCSNQNTAGKLFCKAEQALFVAKTRQRIVGVVIDRNGEGNQVLKAKVHLPHGVKLAAGLKLWIDDGEKRAVDITFADADGSYAVFPIDEKLAGEIKTGKILRLQVEAMAGKATVFELKLDGISNALKYVEEFH
jgi:invasion protein IalB